MCCCCNSGIACLLHPRHHRLPSSSYPTFELRQRRKLNRSALRAVLGRALRFSLFLGLPHGLSGKAVHFLGCGDGRHFDAPTVEDLRHADVLLDRLKKKKGFQFWSPCSHQHKNTEPTARLGDRILSKSCVILCDRTWSLGIRVRLSPNTKASLEQLVFGKTGNNVYKNHSAKLQKYMTLPVVSAVVTIINYFTVKKF